MPELKNLDVQWVSLVDRAAVRDPDDPTAPMRFLLAKGEQPDPRLMIWKRQQPDEAERVEQVKADTAALRERFAQVERRGAAMREGVETVKAETAKLATATAELRERLQGQEATMNPLEKSDEEKALARIQALKQETRDREIGHLEVTNPRAALIAKHGLGAGAEPKPALAEAQQKAAEIRKADPAMSDIAALDKVLSTDQDLQERYLSEARG